MPVTTNPRMGEDDIEMGASTLKEPSCHAVLRAGSEDELQVHAYRTVPWMRWASYAFVVATLGLLRLLFYWKPDLWVKLTAHRCSFEKADVLIIKDVHHQTVVRPVKSTSLDDADSYHTLAADDRGEASRLTQFTLLSPGGSPKHFKTIRFFTFRKSKFLFDEGLNQFRPFSGLDDGVACNSFHNVHSAPLATVQVAERYAVYGPNTIAIKLQPLVALLFREVLNPFYVFQIFSVCVWFSDEYYYYASVIILISAFSIALDVYQIRKNQLSLRNMVNSSDVVQVLRPASPVNNTSFPRQISNRFSRSSASEDFDGHGSSDVVVRRSSRSEDAFLDSIPKGDPVRVSSGQLVPGDVILVPPHGCTLQCDAVLLEGNCIVNESMLTGESVPVTKTPIPDDPELIYDSKEHARHTLYCGTRVLQTRFYGGSGVRAVVVRTGFWTEKGSLIRSIMYPKPVDFEFTKDLLRMVGILSLVALVGFLYAIVVMKQRGATAGVILVRALDIITIVVPPALPFAMTIGIVLAQTRLKKRAIFCISPSTINTCGGINVVVFDKTGTLTEDGLDFHCVIPVKSGAESLLVDERDATDPVRFEGETDSLVNRTGDIFVHVMAACNSLTVIDGELTGDPLDLILLNCTGWELEEPSVDESAKFDQLMPTVVRPGKRSTSRAGGNSGGLSHLELGILRQLPFTSSLQRMSVVVRALGMETVGRSYYPSSGLVVYCKGSPEVVTSLCLKSTIPEDFANVLKHKTEAGYRVIALAYKGLKMSYLKVQKAPRDDFESDLIFLGLVVLENRLKPMSTPVIRELHNAHVRTIMATGDNLLTALSVARECGVITPAKAVYAVEHEIVRDKCRFSLRTVESTSNTDGFELESSVFLRPSLKSQESFSDISSPITLSGYMDRWKMLGDSGGVVGKLQEMERGPTLNYQLVMDGATFMKIIEFNPDLVPSVVATVAVMARMAPDQKARVITELQDLGYIVSMCGDGANDCGALKAAHAGISLSDAEASIASPFTSRTPDISCVPVIIREGRAALVTSFGIFKYMAAYSLTQFFSVSLLYWLSTNIADFQFLYIDLFLITLLVSVFGYTEPSPVLSPRPPATRIMSLPSIASIFWQIFLVAIFQIFIFLFVPYQPWYTVAVQDPNEKRVDTYEVTCVFCISIFQYIILAAVNSKSAPHRKSILNNKLLAGCILLTTSVSLLVTLGPPSFLVSFLELKPPDAFNFRLLIVILAMVQCVAAFLIEWYLVDWLLIESVRMRRLLLRLRLPGLSRAKVPYELLMDKLARTPGWLEENLGSSYVSESSSATGSPKIVKR